jgi:hypothetical protein
VILPPATWRGLDISFRAAAAVGPIACKSTHMEGRTAEKQAFSHGVFSWQRWHCGCQNLNVRPYDSASMMVSREAPGAQNRVMTYVEAAAELVAWHRWYMGRNHLVSGVGHS